MREKLLFDSGWKYHFGDITMEYPKAKGPVYMQAKTETMLWGPASVSYNDHSDRYDHIDNTDFWENVELPHDGIISQAPSQRFNNALGYFDYQNLWYRKHFRLSPEDASRHITLYFEGVTGNATIYLNGCIVGRHNGGYAPFEVDITDFALFDRENILAVYVDVSHHEGWWYEGAGIYRHVWLVKTDTTAVDLWGVYVCPVKHEENWSIDLEVTLRNTGFEDDIVTTFTEFFDPDGTTVAQTEEMPLEIAAKDKKTLCARVSVGEVRLWDIDSPALYTARTTVKRGGAVIDTVTDRFGFRTFFFDPDKGFFLNDRPVKIKGVCCHQDFGLTGRAVADNIYRYRIELMKEMGANGYRTAHYPHSEATMEALDEIGLVVMDETRWFSTSPEAKEQLVTLIKRDRNHPSVILWSVGNEEPFHTEARGVRITKTLKALVRQYDTSRPVTTAVSIEPLSAPTLDVCDVIGVNYNLNAYDEIHKKYPHIPFVSSECCATGTTRGHYADEDPVRGYINAYDHDTNAWFLGRENTWRFFMEREWVSGSFQWAGIEHRGETVWPRLCSQSGAVDLFLQKKDAFYQNKSHWSDEPVLHLLPHWNHAGQEGESIAVWAYTNCEQVELYLNGKSVGIQTVEPYSHAAWSVPYESGVLEVVGRNGGKDVAHDRVETSGEPVALRLTQENTVTACGQDVALVRCECIDSEGRTVPDAKGFTVEFCVNAHGVLLGTGSDVSDHVPVTSPDRRMRAGVCVAAVRVKGTGDVKVSASAFGLKSAQVRLVCKE